MKYLYKKNYHKAYTLVELLLALFIMMVILTISSTSIASSYFSGKTHSTDQKELTLQLNNISLFLENKMANANAYNPTLDIYGFKIDNTDPNNQILVIASQGPSCNFIKFDSENKKLLAAQNDCSAIPTIDQPLSAANIHITGFLDTDLTTGSYQFDSANPNITPYLKVNITAKDAKELVSESIQNTYTLELQTVQNF